MLQEDPSVTQHVRFVSRDRQKMMKDDESPEVGLFIIDFSELFELNM